MRVLEEELVSDAQENFQPTAVEPVTETMPSTPTSSTIRAALPEGSLVPTLLPDDPGGATSPLGVEELTLGEPLGSAGYPSSPPRRFCRPSVPRVPTAAVRFGFVDGSREAAGLPGAQPTSPSSIMTDLLPEEPPPPGSGNTLCRSRSNSEYWDSGAEAWAPQRAETLMWAQKSVGGSVGTLESLHEELGEVSRSSSLHSSALPAKRDAESIESAELTRTDVNQLKARRDKRCITWRQMGKMCMGSLPTNSRNSVAWLTKLTPACAKLRYAP